MRTGLPTVWCRATAPSLRSPMDLSVPRIIFPWLFDLVLYIKRLKLTPLLNGRSRTRRWMCNSHGAHMDAKWETSGSGERRVGEQL